MLKNKKFLVLTLALILAFSFNSLALRDEGQYGGVLIRDAAYGDPENLDPIVRGRMAAMMVTKNLFDGLVAHDPETTEVIPAIAHSWEISPDGLVYTFYLREDAVFHNGRQINAHDFIFSFERLVNPANMSPLAWYLNDVVGVRDFEEGKVDYIAGLEAINDFELQITLASPNSGFITYLGFPGSSAVPREEVERLGADFGHYPVGSGPFKFVGWTKDDHVELAAFEDYYLGRPYLDGLVFRVIPEASAKEAEFITGNLDFYIAPAATYRRVRNNPDFADNILTVAELFTRHVGLHNQKPPFDDVRVRQAFNYAIDVETIIEVVLGGKGIPATGFLPSSSYAFNPDLQGYDYNPEKARQLLAEAGYGDGLIVPIMTNEHPEWGLPVVEAMMGFLSDVGITLVPEVMETGSLFDRFTQGDYVSYIYSTGGDPSPVFYLYRFHTERQETVNRYSNPEVDALIERAIASTDQGEILALVHQIEEIIVADAPIFFFHYNMAVMLHQDHVHGVQASPIDLALQDMWRVWMDPIPVR